MTESTPSQDVEPSLSLGIAEVVDSLSHRTVELTESVTQPTF